MPSGIEALAALQSLGISIPTQARGAKSLLDIQASDERHAMEAEWQRIQDKKAKESKRAFNRQKRSFTGRMAGSILGWIIGNLIAPGVGGIAGAGIGSGLGQVGGANYAIDMSAFLPGGKPWHEFATKRRVSHVPFKYDDPGGMFYKGKRKELKGKVADIEMDFDIADKTFEQQIIANMFSDAFKAWVGQKTFGGSGGSSDIQTAGRWGRKDGALMFDMAPIGPDQGFGELEGIIPGWPLSTDFGGVYPN
jgi:uncharacterized protein YcfJ